MFGCKPFNNTQICVKEIVNGYEISAAFDDSYTGSKQLFRGDIRVYRVSDDKDVTSEFFPDDSTVIASIDNLTIAASIARSK